MSEYYLGEPERQFERDRPGATPVVVYTSECEHFDLSMRSPALGPTRLHGGVLIAAVVDGEVVAEQKVWQTGQFLKRPFFERRLERALGKICREAGIDAPNFSEDQ